MSASKNVVHLVKLFFMFQSANCLIFVITKVISIECRVWSVGCNKFFPFILACVPNSVKKSGVCAVMSP